MFELPVDPKLAELRKDVAELQAVDAAPEKSKEMIAAEAASESVVQEEVPSEAKEKLSPELLKAKAQELLDDNIQILKGTAKGVWANFVEKLGEELTDFSDNTLEQHSTITTLITIPLMVAGIGAGSLAGEAGIWAGMAAGYGGGLKVSHEVSKLLRSKGFDLVF